MKKVTTTIITLTETEIHLIQGACRGGEKMAAVKFVRDALGIGLVAAKLAVDEVQRIDPNTLHTYDTVEIRSPH